MIAHYFKIIWNRKKQNFLLMLELFIAFLVLCVLFIQGIYLLLNYQEPMGFNYKNVWVLSLDPKQDETYKWTAANTEKLRALSQAIKQLEGTKEIAGTNIVAYSNSNNTSSDSVSSGERISIELSGITDEGKDVLELSVTRGRWFGPEDDGSLYTPIIINERYVAKAFPGEDPIGKRVMPILSDGKDSRYAADLAAGKVKEYRIVGVISDYRKNGELSTPTHFAFTRKSPTDTLMSGPPRYLLIRVEASSMNGQYEEKLLKTVEAIAPEWSFKATTMEKMRKKNLDSTLTPLLSFAMVAIFLLVMVGLGLVGVIWQNVTARTGEIGLRRALGASAQSIFQQILGELLMMSSLSVIAGTLLVAQVPLFKFDFLKDVTFQPYFFGWLLAVVVIATITIICGLYPSKLANAVQPTEALHDE